MSKIQPAITCKTSYTVWGTIPVSQTCTHRHMNCPPSVILYCARQRYCYTDRMESKQARSSQVLPVWLVAFGEADLLLHRQTDRQVRKTLPSVTCVTRYSVWGRGAVAVRLGGRCDGTVGGNDVHFLWLLQRGPAAVRMEHNLVGFWWLTEYLHKIPVTGKREKNVSCPLNWCTNRVEMHVVNSGLDICCTYTKV